MDFLLVLPIVISFLICLTLMPYWIRKANQINLLWEDMNKVEHPKVVGSGGIMVVLSFVLGALVFVAYNTFILGTQENLIQILSLLVSILFLSGIGIVDDLLGWRKGGLSRRSRMILVFFASVPLMAINAGKTVISLPIIGGIDVGLIYPLFFIPIGIIGASTTFNFLAGFNGLEAGNGIIILTGLSIVAFFTGHIWLAVIMLCLIFSLLAFLIFNFCPAKVFPGNSITYVIGGFIAIAAILGNFEKIAVFFFIPYIIETILKSRGRLVKQSFGIPDRKGYLEAPYSKIYGLTHMAIYFLKRNNIRATEKKVVYLIWLFQILIIILGLIVFNKSVFQ